MKIDFQNLEKKVNISFKNKDLLIKSLTHKSFDKEKNKFYILKSKEKIRIPSHLAGEMIPYDTGIGDFRAHYAGFFDPGFGNADAGGKGSRGVLEVRCHEAPFALEHGQSVGRLVYEKMSEIPDVLYGSDLKSNYQGQGLKLSKHFKKNK